MDGLWSVPIVWFLLGPTARTRRNLQHTRSHTRTLRMRSCSLSGLKLADTGITTEPRGLTATQPRPADLFYYRCCPGAARGDAAQAAFVDGRPQPAITRTLQHAADIASSRNGQQMSARSLHRRWKHEIQIASLRRRAAMTRAVLPNPSACTERLRTGIIDRALNHWGHLLPLDCGVGGNDNAASETHNIRVSAGIIG